jgi:signal transduction histidine kinase
MAMTMLFSLGIGYFIHTVIGQADRNALLLLDLQSAQESLAASQHEAGILAERERVSREIHDTLAQGFMSVVTLSQVAQRSLDKGNVEAARDRIALMEATARENLAEARALVAGYAPVDLQGQSVGSALERLTSRWSKSSGIEVALSVADDLSLPSSHEVALLRAAQEALNNVRRHAQASAVSVALRLDPSSDAVTLIVADDGIGISDDVGAGFGLTGMRDRVVAVGGTVEVAPSIAGRGTAITVRIPAVQ